MAGAFACGAGSSGSSALPIPQSIFRADAEHDHRYRVFYVSEYPFADGNRFPEFLETVRLFFPNYRLSLRHIRDVDGHFVTIEEYQQRVRK